MSQELYTSILNGLDAITFYFSLGVLRFSQWVRQKVLWQKSGNLERGILIVGDGVAEGVGDGFAHGGLAARLALLMQKESEDNGLRLRWRVATSGVLNATSDDWVPGSDRPGDRHLFGVKKSLFVDTFVDGKFKDADVVLIFLGYEDERLGGDPLNPRRTIDNLKTLALELEKMGKQVLISPLPTFTMDQEEKRRIYERNQLIKAFADSETNPNSSISLGPDTSIVTSQGGYLCDPTPTGYTFSSHGYRMLARLSFDALLNPCRRVEWAHWKPQLGTT